jgi:thiol-disulfide isomerase/thioredoxin
MFKTALALVVAFALYTQTPAAPPSQVPAPASTTPGACVKEVRDYAAKRRADVPPLPPPPAPPADANAKFLADLQAAQAALSQQRALVLRQVDADRIAMAKACAAKFDVKTAADGTLPDLAALYSDAAQPEMAKAAINRAMLVLKTLPEPDRAAVLLLAIQTGLREPATPERNAGLETYISSFDKLSDAVLDQKFSAHTSMNGYYRYDDLDGGIIEHSTWIIETAKRFTPEQRKKYGLQVVGAYVNMAEAWAGEGMNDKAIALLHRATVEMSDVPNVASRVQPEIDRLELVGTAAAPLSAPRWLNMPAGKTTLDLKGHVTLLEFSAHWCIPCKESYPGVNRLRAKYGPQGFQAVVATQLYGYFAQERPLDAATEFERDKTYFAEHGLDVPIAVGDHVTVRVVGGKVEYSPAPDPNDTAYKVGGIPQIMLIDKQGKIRLMMVGYDDANEPKLAKMIEGMIKEK